MAGGARSIDRAPPEQGIFRQDGVFYRRRALIQVVQYSRDLLGQLTRRVVAQVRVGPRARVGGAGALWVRAGRIVRG
jgi:hypothetical protein